MNHDVFNLNEIADIGLGLEYMIAQNQGNNYF